MKRNSESQPKQGNVNRNKDIGLNEWNKPIPVDLYLPKIIGDTQAYTCRTANCREYASCCKVADAFDLAALILWMFLADIPQVACRLLSRLREYARNTSVFHPVRPLRSCSLSIKACPNSPIKP
jgi:hypothetical protein